jgi:hypothetical protein
VELNYGKMQVHGEIWLQDDPHKVGIEEEEEEEAEWGVVVMLVVVVPVIFRMLHTDLRHLHAFVCLQTRVPIRQLIFGKIMTAEKEIRITINVTKV